MVKKTRYGDFTFGWDQTLGNMEANGGELSHLEHARLALQGIRDRVRRLQYEQSYHEAERQRATRELTEALAEGEKTATFLRVGIKLVYGNDSDKLLEFGIQPLRRRSGEKRKKAAKPEAPREEGLQNLEQVDGDVAGSHQSLIERPEAADELVSIETGEEKGIDPVPVRLLVDADQRLAPGAGKHGSGDEGEPPGREDRHGNEPPAEALAASERTEAMTRDLLDPPRPGNIGRGSPA